MPESSILVKKSTPAKKSQGGHVKIITKPLLSRERVDRALETLRKSSIPNSPKTFPKVRLSKLSRSDSSAATPLAAQKFSNKKISEPRKVTSYCDIQLPKCWCVPYLFRQFCVQNMFLREIRVNKFWSQIIGNIP